MSGSLHAVFAIGGGIYTPVINYIPGQDTYHRDYVRFAYQVVSGSITQLRFNFSTSTRANFSSTNYNLSGLIRDGGWHYVTYRVDNIGDWRGASRITQMRFVALGSGGGGASGTINFDFVALREDDKLPQTYNCSRGTDILSVSPGGWTNGPITVTVRGNDPGPYGFAECGPTPPDEYGAGVASFRYTLNGSTTTLSYDNQDSQWPTGWSQMAISIPAGSIPTGAHTFSVHAYDRVGFEATTNTTTTVYYDGTPPGMPTISVVSPSYWSSSNGFYIAWTNPGDAGSGVAYYDVTVDGGYIGSAGGTSASFTVPSNANGSHSVQVRAVDNAGNAGSVSAPAYVYLDQENPGPPGVPSVNPSGYSTQDSYTFSWTPGSDGVSGVYGYLYSVDGAPATFTTATSVSGALAGAREGQHVFYVATEDNAGNVSSWQSVTFDYYPRYVLPVTGLAPSGTPAALPSTFSWNETGAGHTYFVQVSADPGFASGSTPTFYSDVPWFMVPAFAAPVTGQTYYWRAMTTQSYPDNWSAAAQFNPYIPPPPPAGQVIGQEFPSGEAGEGVNTSLGATTRGFTILTLRGPGGEVPLNAWYSSISQRNSLLGSRWNWTLGQLLTPSGGGAAVTLEDNQDLGFTQNGAVFTPAVGIYDSLSSSDGGYALERPSRTNLTFDNLGTLKQVRDRNGNTITLHYSGGVLTSFDDQAGRSYVVTVSNSRLTQIRDMAGRTWAFEYSGGYLSAVTDAIGARTQFQYDGQGRMTKVIDPRLNNAVQHSYDSTGRVATQTDALGNVTTFTYDDVNRRTRVTDPLGKTKVHVYDVNFRLVQDIDENGNTTTYAYDANHNRISTTDPLGHSTTYTYDPRGNVYLVVDAAGNSTRTVFDYSNQPVYRLLPYGKTNVWRNDPAGNPVEIDERVVLGGPLTKQSYFSYNSAGQILSLTDSDNHITSHEYDGQGNRTKTTDGSGVITTFGYDAVGRRTSATDGLNHTTTFRYDADGRLLTRTDALQDSTTHVYDANGNRTAVVDPRGFRTEYTYDLKNRLTQVKDALGDLTQHAYDALDRKLQITDPRGGVTTFRYDPVGNVLSERDALEDSTTHTYDAVGSRLSTTSPRGKTTTFSYDALNRLVRTTDPLGHFTTNAYDSLGRLVSVMNARQYTTTYVYDLLNRLAAVQAPTGQQLQYGYDLVGNRTSTTNANVHTTTMTYDGANRLLTVQDPLQHTQTYAYDLAGRQKNRTDGRGKVTTYFYDAADRLIQTTFDDNTTIARGYDRSGNLLALTDQWGSESYGYDGLNRIATSTDHYGNDLAFAYDSTGNLVTITYPAGEHCRYSFDPLNRLSGVTDWNSRTVAYAYDADGNNTRSTYPNGVGTTQAFDDAGHLLSILTLTPSRDTLVSFAYTLDENGNRARIVRVDKREDPTRGGGSDVYATSAALTSSAFPSGADSVVLASGEDWTQAVNAPVVAKRMGVPALVIPGDNLWASPPIQAELARLKGQRQSVGAVVLGDVGGVSAVVEAQLGQEGFTPRRIRGADRFGTAAQAAGPPSPYAVLLGSTDAARAGGAALLASRLGAPLLFTERDSLPAATRAALAVAGVTRAILLGDLTTIGQGVTDWLNSNGHPVWKRHSGDASAVSVAALEDTLQSPDRFANLQIANRHFYQDAFSAAGSSNTWTTATLLAGPDSVRNSVDIIRWLGRHKGWVQHATLLGPTSALSDNAAAELRNLLRTTVTEYAYSPLDELTSEIIPGSDTTLYNYDPMGNRASITHSGAVTTYGYDGADRLASAGLVTYAYDGNGNRLSDTQGSTTTAYAFDYENRLTQITGQEGVSTYRYNGLGRRIRSQESGRTVRYALDPTAKPYRTLRETDDAGVTQASYVHGDGLVSDVSPTGATRYFHFDGLGSTAAITDSTGNDVGHLGYTAFGDTAIQLGAPDSRLGYVGRFGVEATAAGLEFMRDRFYDPQTGMFLSTESDAAEVRDPLSMAIYLYVAGNPVGYVDPDGHAKKPKKTSSLVPDLVKESGSHAAQSLVSKITPDMTWIKTAVTGPGAPSRLWNQVSGTLTSNFNAGLSVSNSAIPLAGIALNGIGQASSDVGRRAPAWVVASKTMLVVGESSITTILSLGAGVVGGTAGAVVGGPVGAAVGGFGAGAATAIGVQRGFSTINRHLRFWGQFNF